MFIEQRKKKNYRTFIYAAIIVVLCLIIVVIAWPADVPAADATDISVPPAADVSEPGKYAGAPAENSEDKDNSEQEVQNQDIVQTGPAYYLVRRDGSLIKVFFVDEKGSETELETTGIIYEMLGTEDQKLFDDGYRVDSQQELAVLLQDFES